MIKSPLSKHRYFQESVALRALNITSKGFFCFFKCQALLRLKLCQIPFTVELHVSKTCKIKAPICYPCILGAGESLESVFPSWCSSRIEPEEEMLRMVYVASFLALERQICWVAPNSALQLPAYAALGNTELLLESREIQPGIYYLPAVI